MKKRGRKGQITLFIILGIIILVSVSLFIYLKGDIIDKETEVERIIEEVPDWARPVQMYVEDCIEDVAISAFKKMGQHGGYIDFDDYEIVGRYFDINLHVPTLSDAVSRSPSDLSPIAYWWYMSTKPNNCNECFVDSLRPTVEYMEKQAERYVNRELLLCLDNFKSFRAQNMGFETGSPNTTINVNLNDVTILVDYPIEVRLPDFTVDMEQFFVRLDFDFNSTYLLASSIAGWEMGDMFLEDITMYLIGGNSLPLDSEKIPPTFWPDNEVSITTWQKEGEGGVREKIGEEILGGRIPLIQINNTRNPKHITVSDPIEQGAYDVLFLDFLSNNFPDQKVDFFYNPNWEYYLDITPRNGNILRPSTSRTGSPLGLGFFTSETTNYYEFFYDISFPVIVVIRDNSSLTKHGEEGYTFMFGLEVNIRDNKDLSLWNEGRGTVGPVDYNDVSVDTRTTTESSTGCEKMGDDECIEFINDDDERQWKCSVTGSAYYPLDVCNRECVSNEWYCSVNGETYTTPDVCNSNCVVEVTSDVSISNVPTLICDYEQRISENITIRTFDDRTNDALPNVPIKFGCGNYRECSMESTGDDGTYVGKFPMCIGDGYLFFQREGYLSEKLPHVSIRPGQGGIYDAYLEPIIEKEVEAYFINVTNMFRVKRLLLHEGNGVLFDLSSIYVDIIATVNSLKVPLIIQPDDQHLSSDEANDILTVIAGAGNDINRAKSLIQNYEHYSQVRREKVVEATYLARDAAESIRKILRDRDYVKDIIGGRFRGSISITPSVDSLLIDIIFSLNEELGNVQFLDGDDLNNPENLDFYRGSATKLGEGGILSVTYEKIKENIYEQNLPRAISQMEYGSDGVMGLVPGEYNLNMMFRNEPGVVIPASGYLTEDIEIPLLGGAEISNNTFEWTVTREQLDSSSKIRFYFFRVDDPLVVDDIAEMQAVTDYSRRYREYIEPEFLS
ncbi:MAG: hypothetical protein U9O94_01795 [Nanoarchaeota archaeon]|nr:hypothetical protein [Nanoarchaeota archaeon]